MIAPPTPATFEQRRQQAHAALRTGQAASAERLLRALESQCPGEVNCLWLIGAALLAQGKTTMAVEGLERVVTAAPDFPNARVDLARAYTCAGSHERAREELRRVLKTTPTHHHAWLAYGDVLVELGQYADARAAFERARHTDPYRQRIEAGTAAFVALDRKRAEEIFRAILQEDASHVGALCGLAALSLAAGQARDAERLLRHALKQSMHLPLAWRGLGPALQELGKLLEADQAVRHILKIEPANPQNWVMLGSVSSRLLRQDEALTAYETAARLNPKEVRLRMSIGHLHKTAGRRGECEEAYRASLELDPGLAEAYWSLADLKNYQFSDAEIAAMRRLLGSDAREHANEAQLHFALGRALEQRQDYAQAFTHYERGNALRRLDAPFDIAKFEAKSARVRAFFDAAFFRERAGSGDQDGAAIFIVGLPRSGSTLIEQILASHSQVEGTMELPNILTLVREFDRATPAGDAYPQSVGAASRELLAGLGRRYLNETAPLRQGRPRFIDKMPNNFSHVGLIHAILPNATVIDVRRHPMDACFSTFKQHFAEGQSFSYDLEGLARYYRSYLSLIDHWSAVLPGKVLTVSYEAVVRDPEANIRRLLEHCRLPFEAACLSFHETRRPVRTASAEQVRQPLYASGVGYWRHFARELEPLRLALGESLQRFEGSG
jgi:tetratricopeptide (TPR) repeat protein